VTSYKSQKCKSGSDRRLSGWPPPLEFEFQANDIIGNYHLKIDMQVNKNMLTPKIAEAEVYTNFQDNRRRLV
jgi:hypothetical protein